MSHFERTLGTRPEVETEIEELTVCDLCSVATPFEQVHFFNTVRMHICADCQPAEKTAAIEQEEEDYLSEILDFEASQRIPNNLPSVRAVEL